MPVPRLPSVETMMANDEASRGLGIELTDQDEGRAVTRMTVRADAAAAVVAVLWSAMQMSRSRVEPNTP